MPRLVFRMPVAEVAILVAVFVAFSGAQLVAHHSDVVGDPIPVPGGLEVVAIYGVGAELRDREGRRMAYWELPPSHASDPQSLIEFARQMRERLPPDFDPAASDL